ncbi:MAG: DUF6285 domain-containing protein [Myxococcaceae bacterium]
MQERPAPRAVLEALSRFLLEELQPAAGDKRLGFRVLIAAHLASTLAAELEGRRHHAESELRRLRVLLPEVVASSAEPETALRTLNATLAERLRLGEPPADDAALRAHLRQTLADALSVLSPRFDTSPDIEG